MIIRDSPNIFVKCNQCVAVQSILEVTLQHLFKRDNVIKVIGIAVKYIKGFIRETLCINKLIINLCFPIIV